MACNCRGGPTCCMRMSFVQPPAPVCSHCFCQLVSGFGSTFIGLPHVRCCNCGAKRLATYPIPGGTGYVSPPIGNDIHSTEMS